VGRGSSTDDPRTSQSRILRVAVLLRVLFVLLFFSQGLVAQELRVPELRDPVTDEVGLLSPDVSAALSGILRALYAQTGTQMAILVTQDTQGRSLEDFSIKIVEKWKLGSEKSDRGALLLIVRGERKIRIEVGRGLEGDLTDLRSRDIIDHRIAPAFKNGNFDLGVTDGILTMIQYSHPDFSLESFSKVRSNMKSLSAETSGFTQGTFVLFLLQIFLLGFFFLGPSEWFAQGGGRGPWRRRGYHGNGWSPGSGRGGGGWSGGGGGFGGGGASGNW
jgi:uncharacterized protein